MNNFKLASAGLWENWKRYEKNVKYKRINNLISNHEFFKSVSKLVYAFCQYCIAKITDISQTENSFSDLNFKLASILQEYGKRLKNYYCLKVIIVIEDLS